MNSREVGETLEQRVELRGPGEAEAAQQSKTTASPRSSRDRVAAAARRALRSPLALRESGVAE